MNFIQKSLGRWQLNSDPFGWRCVMADMDYGTEGEDCKSKLYDHIHDLLWHMQHHHGMSVAFNWEN